MTDTITESFCERCGTRYSFEQATPRRRGAIGRVRVLTRGLRNYVANDGMPMDEAMAAAQNDEERAGVSRQLDAFHRTFNFCMSCRQYTCANCWNAKVGECLTCAPDLSREVLPAPFPDLPLDGPAAADHSLGDGGVVGAAAWPSTDLARAAAIGAAAIGAAATAPDDAGGAEEPAVLARLEAFVAVPAGVETEELTVTELEEIETALAGVHAEAEEPQADGAAEADVQQPAAATADHVASARGQTRSLLGRFRPAHRRDVAEPAEAAGAAAAPMATPTAAGDAVLLASTEVTAEPAALDDAATFAAEPTTEPAEAPPLEDAIEQPTWRVVAPDAVPAPRPDWPEAPAWPSPDPHAIPAGQVPRPGAAPWAARLATARPEPGSVWAASSQEVLTALGPAPTGRPGTPAVQACVSCGLSLSANARFCRRCGSRQA